MSADNDNQAKPPPPMASFEYVYVAYEVQPFDIDEYVQNPAMIKKLNEEKRIARAASTNLQNKLEKKEEDNRQLELQKKELEYRLLEKQKETSRLAEEKQTIFLEQAALKAITEQLKENNHQLELQKRELDAEQRAMKEKLDKSRRTSFLEYIVSLAWAIVLGFGVNIITSTPYDLKGWVVISVSVILAVVAFFMHERQVDG